MSDGGRRPGNGLSADFCSVNLRTEQYGNDGESPLEQYRRRGYVTRGGRRSKARDPAVALTASRWGPPFDTPVEGAGEWWFAAYACAARAVEGAIVNGVLDG